MPRHFKTCDVLAAHQANVFTITLLCYTKELVHGSAFDY